MTIEGRTGSGWGRTEIIEMGLWQEKNNKKQSGKE